jgi:acetylornithine deacetylase
MDKVKKQVLKNIDDGREDLITLVKDLIQFRSITFHPSLYSRVGEERQCQEFIGKKLEGLGFTCEMWEPDSGELNSYRNTALYVPGRTYKNRPNLAATKKGTGGGKSILLTGHIDVVPAEANEDWDSDPWEPKVKNGYLFGRGSVDMKSGIAIIINAIESITRADVRLKGDIVIGTTVDEEAGGMGALSFCAKGYRADAGILTEPTDMQIHLMCRGILHGKITVKGRSGHIEIEQPHWRIGGAVDAFKKGLLIVNEINNLNDDWSKKPEKNHPLLGSPCRVDITMVRAGQQPSSYPSECSFIFDAQYLPDERDESGMGGRVRKEIESYLKRVVESDDWLAINPPKLEWLDDADCVEIPPTHPLVKVLSNNLNEMNLYCRFGGSGFHSENSVFSNIGRIPTILFGPGNPAKAHQANENLKIEDIITATKVIALSVMDWCGYEE